jgi:hypothetical protein
MRVQLSWVLASDVPFDASVAPELDSIVAPGGAEVYLEIVAENQAGALDWVACSERGDR